MGNGPLLTMNYPQNGRPTSTHTFAFSRFWSKTDNTPQPTCITWPEIVAMLEKRAIREQKDGPLLSGASYPDGKTRGNENVSFVSLAILDFDDGTDLDFIEAHVASLNSSSGAAAFFYSTFSHDEGIHKYRLVLPLLEPVAASDWPQVWERLSLAFDSAPDASAKDAARMHYRPSCPKSREHLAVSLEWEGPLLDVETLPQLPADDTPPEARELPAIAFPNARGDNYARKAFEAEIGRLCATTRNRNDALNCTAKRLGQFIGAGRLDRAEVETALLDAARANGYIEKDGEGEARSTMRSGLEAGVCEPNQKGIPDERPASLGSKGIREPRPEENEAEKPSKLIRIGALRNRPAPKWLIQRFLVQNATSLFTADSGSYKSFIALHIAYCIAHGLPFFGRGVVESGPVVYVAGEGGDGLRARSIAWDKHHEREAPENLFLWESAVQLANASEVAAFLAELEAAGVCPSLIIFDTLNRCAEGLDENSAGDMGLFIAGLERIKRATGAHICVVHHNNAGGKSRGSTALPGAFDTRFNAEREGQTVTLRCQKQKDGAEEFEPFAVSSRVIEIGEVDDFGDPITSLVLEPSDSAPASENQINKTGAKARTGATILEELAKLHATKKDGATISKTDWEEAVVTKAGICSRSLFYKRTKELEREGRWYWWKGDCRLEKAGESPISPLSPTSPKLDELDLLEQDKSTKSNKSNNPLGLDLLDELDLSPNRARKNGEEKKARSPKKRAAVDGEPYGDVVPDDAITNTSAGTEPDEARL